MEKKLNSRELKDEMLAIILEANTPEKTNFLINVRQKIAEANDLNKKSMVRLNELRAMSKEKIVSIDIGSIEENYKKNKEIKSEISYLENLISSLARDILPSLEEDLINAKERTFEVISPGFYPIKKKLQAEIDNHLAKVNEIKSAYDEAVTLLKEDPRFHVIFHIDNYHLLMEFSYSLCPRGFFDPKF
jgi:hypothetical protein